LDLSLADSHGWGTFDKMHGHTAHVPIVVLTGLDDEAVAVRAMGEGVQDFLVKGHVDGQLLGRKPARPGDTFFFTLPVFPLVGLLSPIIKANNWQIEGLVLITIEFCFRRRSLLTLMRETLLR
jgi:CheY-like chemotaxis protein